MLKILFHLPISFSKFCLAVFFFCISTNACAQNDNSLNNREAFKLTLAVDSASYYATEIGAGPYLVGQDILQIYPGEKVYLEANSDSGKLIKLQLSAPSKAKTIDYVADNDWDGSRDSLLLGTNGIAALTFSEVPISQANTPTSAP